MVEFCTGCRSSLPKADVSIVDGKVFASFDYICPFCNEPANPRKTSPPKAVTPTGEQDVLIRQGTVEAVPPEATPGK